MTTTYDPKHAEYFEESDVRNEIARVHDVCNGCRKCVDFCSTFPTLFSYVDNAVDNDAGRLTPAQQDHIADSCFQCKLCYVSCPYIPSEHELAIDFPRLMLRQSAMRVANHQVGVRDRLATRTVGHADTLGALASSISVVTNIVMGAKPGSLPRKVLEKTMGISSYRLLPPYAKQRFSTWFKKRAAPVLVKKQGSVAVYPTCVVEYQQPSIGHDLVKVYERNGVSCTIVQDAGCCGAPYLHSGDVASFTKVARKQVAVLARAVREGNDIVIAQPTCSYIVKKDYVDYVGGPDAQLVAEHTYDSSEYLMKMHQDGAKLDTDFSGDVPDTIAYHLPCHLRAQDAHMYSYELMALTGAAVEAIDQCSGIDGMWGLKAGNEHLSVPFAVVLGEKIAASGGQVIAGDCHLANTAITEQTGRVGLHPLQVLARAYGISPEPL